MSTKELVKDIIEEVSEAELESVVGGRKGRGWFATITDDCPNSLIVCC